MIKLNLTTANKEQERVLNYLQENASNLLAEKINNGVYILKDGKKLLNKKDLNGFMKYALSEAKKLADNGAIGAFVEDSVVFGWAIHYFEEDSIEGTLFNEDGSEFTPVKAKPTQTVNKTTNKAKNTNKTAQNQFSLFDLMSGSKEDKNEPEEDDEDPLEEDIEEAFEQTYKEEVVKPKGSPVYQKYMEVQDKYPDCIIAYRLGDFYEIFGENAKRVSNKLDLTLTGRDCGLDERIPMVGFSHHCADNYFDKIIEFAKLAVVDGTNVEIKEKETSLNVDYDTGEVFDLTEEEMREFDGDIYEPNDLPADDELSDDELIKTAKSIDKNIMLKLYDLLDGKIDIR